MGQLNDIVNRCAVIGLASASMLLCSGCENQVADGIADMPLSGTLSDYLKPDVNRDHKLLVNPNLVAIDFPDTDYNIYSAPGIGDGGGDFIPSDPTTPEPEDPSRPTGSGGTTSKKTAETWERTVDPSQFAVPTVPIVNASVYERYLQERVFNPINSKLASIQEDTGKSPDIYFRVFHMGYDFTLKSVSTTNPPSTYQVPTVTPGPVMDMQASSNSKITCLSGDSAVCYAVDWLSGLDVNMATCNVENARTNFQSQIATTAADTGDGIEMWSTISSLKGSEDESKVGSRIMSMLEKCPGSDPALEDLSRQAGDNNWSVIPDLDLRFYKSARSLGRVTFNGVTRNKSSSVTGTDKSKIESIFTPYNQFEKRSFAGVNRWGSNAYRTFNDSGELTSYLSTYTDGYHRTVVFLAAADGKTIKEALYSDSSGDLTYDAIMNVLEGSQDWETGKPIGFIPPTDHETFRNYLGTDDIIIPGDSWGKGAY